MAEEIKLRRAELRAGQVFVHEEDSAILYKIPVRRIACPLSRASSPSTVTSEGLSTQLHSIGLGCVVTKPENLDPIIAEVKSELPTGQTEAFQITTSSALFNNFRFSGNDFASGISLMKSLSTVAKPPWEPSATAAGYASDLATIAYYFDDLKDNYPGFQGFKSEDAHVGEYDTVDAIKSLFVKVAISCSAAVITGIKQDSLESVLSNAISPLSDTNTANYDKKDDRLVFLVLDYDEKTKNVAGIGFVYISWHLTIKDYKKKKEGVKHATNLTITAKSIIYDNTKPLNEQLDWISKKYPKSFAMFRSIPVKYEFKVFPMLPPAGEEAFGCSLPLETTSSKLTAMLFYAPNIESLGCLDNTKAKSSSTYSIATTSGFSFSMSETIGAEASIEGSIEIVKASITVSFEFGLSQTWNTSTTETISFEVPGGAASFIYKGIVQTIKIYFDPATRKYSYGSKGVFRTNYIVASEKPITGTVSFLSYN